MSANAAKADFVQLGQDASKAFREGHHSRFCNRLATRAFNGPLMALKALCFQDDTPKTAFCQSYV